jgi:hypothetical protein
MWQKEWRAALQKSLEDFKNLNITPVLLEDTPYPGQDVPTCLSRHYTNVQMCSPSIGMAYRPDIHEMMKEAVEIEKNYACSEMLRDGGIIELNTQALCNYVEYSADRWLSSIACKEKPSCDKLFFKENPLIWMEKISIPTYSEFFERQDVNYRDRFGTKNTAVFSDNSDF